MAPTPTITATTNPSANFKITYPIIDATIRIAMNPKILKNFSI